MRAFRKKNSPTKSIDEKMFNEYEDCQYRGQVTEENQFYKKLHYKQIQYECLKNIQNLSMHVNKETYLKGIFRARNQEEEHGTDIESETTMLFLFQPERHKIL